MAKHICCTGGAGYIGSHTVVKLLESGYKVSIMDNLINASEKVVPRLQELTGQEIPLFKIDACDAAAVDKLFSEQKFDGIIHFAGLKAVGESVAKPMWYYENNLVATINILKSMVTHGCKRLVFSSSATVYRPSEDPLDETMPLGCTNPYGWTKFMIEQILRDFAVANPTFPISILRYFNPVGAHPSGRIGENPHGPPNNLMPFIQQVAVGRRECLSVFGSDYDTPDGTGVRDYIHVDDLAEGHICAMEKLMTMDGGCIIHNLGSGNGYSALVRKRPNLFEWLAGAKSGDVFSTWSRRSRQHLASRSHTRWRSEEPEIWERWWPTPQRPRLTSAGRRSAASRTCAKAPGTGRATTRMAMKRLPELRGSTGTGSTEV